MLLHLLIIAISGLCCVNARLCRDVSVRNNLATLERHLRGCSVIAGNLEILLIERAEEKEFLEKSFPELIEIRGYLLIYRVYQMTTLSELFPNLEIIRGAKLFRGHSIILHDLKHLKEIGLPKLTHIVRGSIRIERCPNLCYVDTLDWNLLGGPSHTVEYNNTNRDICPDCPERCNGLCWNQRYCQKTKFNPCHPECLGCTEPGSAEKCITCRNFEYNGVCVSECPEGKFKQPLALACVTNYECYDNDLPGSWWTFQGQCVDRCPAGYIQIHSLETYSCKFCGKKCKKSCLGFEIHRDSSSIGLHGCTHINGSIGIQVDTASEAEELYKDLGMIEEISGYLNIHHSTALTSLKFLKNLKIIRGIVEYNTTGKRDNYPLMVFENPNLRKLWNYNQTVTLGNGTLFFHDNPELCLSEIEKVAKMSNLTYTDLDVSPTTNGDYRVCHKIELDIDVTVVSSTIATFKWENITATKNARPPVGYQIFYTENRWGNITHYEDEQPFYVNVWESEYVTDVTTHQVVNLLPFTEYAYYLRVYTDSIEEDGQTKLKYFKTPSSYPSELRNLNAASTASDSVSLNWQLPKFPNGILDNYKLVVQYLEDRKNLFQEKNFCKHEFVEKPICTNATRRNPFNCVCPPKFTCDTLNTHMAGFSKTGICRNYMYHHDLRHESIKFANVLPKNRNRMAPNSIFPTNSSNLIEMIIRDPSATSYTVKSLKPFTMFMFVLKVCNKNGLTKCSSPVLTFQRTLPKIDADDIPPGISVNVADSTVIIEWSEPKEPSSMIGAYYIEFKQTDQENSTSIMHCITRDEFVKSDHKFKIEINKAGNYVVRIRALSLAGLGRFSPYKNFEIPLSLASNLFSIFAVTLLSGMTVVIVVSLYLLYKKYRRERSNRPDEHEMKERAASKQRDTASQQRDTAFQQGDAGSQRASTPSSQGEPTHQQVNVEVHQPADEYKQPDGEQPSTSGMRRQPKKRSESVDSSSSSSTVKSRSSEESHLSL